MNFRLIFTTIILLASIVIARSGLPSVVHTDMMAETMQMDCTSSSPCFLAHTSEVNLAVTQKSNLFLAFLAVVVLAFSVKRSVFRFEILQERLRSYRRGIVSLLFLDFCRDFIRHGLLAPKMDAVL